MPSEVLFGGKKIETWILHKLIWGRMRVSGYFGDGERGRSDSRGIKERALPGPPGREMGKAP